MAFYHNVNPGDDFKPSARLENDVRNLLNELNGFKGGGKHTATASKAIRVPVYNTTDDPFVAGQAVSLDIAGNIVGDAYPAIAFDEDYPCFGVCLDGAASGGICDCVLCGLAIVELTGGTGSFARPVDGGTFELADDGLKVLNITGGTTAVVFVGDYEGKRYVEGKGISITGTTNVNEYEISANLVQGTNISITDGTGGSKVISCTAGGGDSFPIPPYNMLYASGGLSASDYGRATTFIIPVKAGNIGFNDDGGGAIGVYTNKAGTTRYALTNTQSYNAASDGWLRISVYDDGSTPGKCLTFFSPTGGVPLYKYGTSNSGGIGFPDYIALSGGTHSDSLGTITDEDYEEGVTVISSPTMPQDPKIGVTYLVPVPANAPIKYYSSFACLVRFAPFAGGGHFYYDLSNDMEWTPNTGGWLRISILDDGSHSSDCIRLFVGTENWSDALPMYKCGSFGNNGATGISSSISGGTVTISLSGGTGSVKLVPGSNISITGSNGVYTIAATGSTSSSGGGIPFPDYAALTTSSSSGTVLTNGETFTATSNGWLRVSIRNDSGLSDGCFRLVLNGADIGFYQYRTNSPGITKFIYIPSGTTVQYSTSSSSSFVKFAPGIGGGMPAPIYTAMAGSGGSALSKSTTYTIPEDGWIRISIRNDSGLSDGCFRIYLNSADIGFYQYRTGSCGVTDFIPVQAGTEFRYETSSTTSYVKYDHSLT